ncbi:hypothetical protein BKA64DRAFT_236943 [Cadophora sp. MPI-SDFR-AT-0126]|nr:hypothetical protein BKA64DRAFT_236943 [Leotiomycetes sp. MPI-SDFR-AT-0126]
MSQGGESAESLPRLETLAIDPKTPAKSIRRERSDAKWESYKGEIQQLYVEQGMPLKRVMQALEAQHGFKFSLRSWKAKMKEWNFEKNLPANEMAFIAAKADKRKADEGKDTVFFRGDIKIESERIDNFKKRKLTATDMADLPVLVDTPCNMTYHTPAAIPELLTEAFVDAGSLIEQPSVAKFQPADDVSFCADGQGYDTKVASADVLNQLSEIHDVDEDSARSSHFQVSEEPGPSSAELSGDAAVASGDDSSSQIFDAEAIRKLVDGIPARPIALDTFLNILRRFLTRTYQVDDDELQSPDSQSLRSSFPNKDSFFSNNAKLIETICAGSGSVAFERSYFRYIETRKFSPFEIESRLLSLLGSIDMPNNHHDKRTSVHLAMELVRSVVKYLQLTDHDKSCLHSLEPIVKDMACYIITNWPANVAEYQSSVSLSGGFPFAGLDSLSEFLFSNDLLQGAEICCRHMIIQTTPEDDLSRVRYQHRLFEILRNKQVQAENPGSGRNSEEFARLSAAYLASRFWYEQDDSGTTIFGQGEESLQSIWWRYHIQTNHNDAPEGIEKNTTRQQVHALLLDLENAFSIEGRITAVMSAKLLSTLTALARKYSLLGWHDIANVLFDTTSRHLGLSSAELALTAHHIRKYAWHALNLQRQQKWTASMDALKQGYRKLIYEYLSRHGKTVNHRKDGPHGRRTASKS